MRFSKTFITLLLFASISSLCGCRTLKAPSDPSADWTPPAWEKSKKLPDKVWTEIRALNVDTSKQLSLYALGDIALRNNPTTRQAWEAARASEAKKGQAEGKLYPALTATMQSDQTRVLVNNKNSVSNVNQIQYGPGFALTYLIFDFGGRDANIKQAYQNLLSSNYQFNQTVQDLLLNVGKSYYELYSAQASVVAAKKDVDNAKTSLVAAEKKFAAGLVSKLDVYQAESTYYSNYYTLEGAKGSVKTAKANLANTLGLPADIDCRIVVPSKEISTNLTKRNISELIEFGLRTRPDIAAARASLLSKELAVKVAESDLWPTVNYQGGIQRDYYRFFNSSKAAGDDYNYTIALISANWNVFDGFANIYKVVQAKAEARQERDKLRQTEIAASADVWIKYYAFKTNTRKYSASKAYYNSSNASYQLALEGYNNGLKSILDLIQSETDLSKARSSLIQSKKDLFEALIDLAHSLGTLTAQNSSKYTKNNL